VQFGGSIRHETANANAGWGLREMKRKEPGNDGDKLLRGPGPSATEDPEFDAD